jgi:hypothetical protein
MPAQTTAHPLHHVEVDFSQTYLRNAARTVMRARLLRKRLFIMLAVVLIVIAPLVYYSDPADEGALLAAALGTLIGMLIGLVLAVAGIYLLLQHNLRRVQRDYRHVHYDFYDDHLVIRTAHTEHRYNYDLIRRILHRPHGFMLELPIGQLIYIPGRPPAELLAAFAQAHA